jgi:hypothetical protein
MDATELSLGACSELARRLTEWVVVQSRDHAGDLCPLAAKDVDFIGAIRSVAEVVGHPPSTPEYQREYEQRRERGGAALPSLSAILKHFDGWPYALAAAGLEPAVAPRGIQRRRTYTRKRVHRYKSGHLHACLRACKDDLGRIPMVRDYVAWREDQLDGQPGRRGPEPEIPHHRTFYNRFGSWAAALESAGMDGTRAARTSSGRGA